MGQPTPGQLVELRWIAEFGSTRSTRQLNVVVQHGWAERVEGQGRYGARLTDLGEALIQATPRAAPLARPDNIFALFD
jgi:hypothetical protein